MIDWSRLISDPVLRNLGALLRAQFGVWVGVIDEFGKAYPAGDEDVDALDRPVCARFCSRAISLELNASRAGASPDAGAKTHTCTQSNRRWNEQYSPGLSDVAAHCHAGLSAMVFGLEDADMPTPSIAQNNPPEGRACVYISGYVHAEHAYERLGKIRALLQANQLAPDSVEATDEMMDTIPRLDRRDRAFIQALGAQFVARARELLRPEGSAQADDKIHVPGSSFYGMIGASRPVLRLFETISMVARSNSTILIQGENGTGKELIARALHAESPRRDRPFVALNCAAVHGDLIARELFGHKRGAFSGAHRDREGLVERSEESRVFVRSVARRVGEQ